MIQLNDLSIGYPGKRDTRVVAQHINARIRGGELTCLMGTNGVGKSTLLRTLSAFQPRLSGGILIKDRELDDYSDAQLARQVGVVLTERIDVRNLSVRALVGMGRSPYTGFWGRLSAEDEAIVDRSIRLIGIEALAHRMADTLSDGERQKVMIAKALAQETPIILLDEPTAFLDFPSKVEIMQLLHRLAHETGKAIFLSTHDLEFALQVADKLWLMSPDREVVIGTPEDLALRGHLTHFFQRRGIRFDAQEGLFRVEFQCPHGIRVEGPEGQRRSMLVKALHRYGYEAQAEGELTAIAGDSTFLLRRGEQPLAEGTDIETILAALQRL